MIESERRKRVSQLSVPLPSLRMSVIQGLRLAINGLKHAYKLKDPSRFVTVGLRGNEGLSVFQCSHGTGRRPAGRAGISIAARYGLSKAYSLRITLFIATNRGTRHTGGPPFL